MAPALPEHTERKIDMCEKGFIRPTNVLMHGFSHVSDRLKTSEKACFLDILEKYRKHPVPLSTPVEVFRAWLIRFDVERLLGQNYSWPFPYQLSHLRDSTPCRTPD